MIYLNDPDFSVLEQIQLGQTFQPSGLQVLSAAVSEGFQQSSGMAALNLFRFSSLGREEGEQPLSEDEFKASRHFREGLAFREDITESQLEILAERHDERKKNEFVLRRADGRMLEKIAGSLVGGIPDPLNFIPFLGSFNAAKFGMRVGKAALEAGIGAALTEPLLFAQADVLQEDHDLRMAVHNIAAALAIGAGFGTVAGGLAHISAQRRALATHKAAQDMIQGRPTDVGPILGDSVDGTVRPSSDIREVPDAQPIAPGEVGRVEPPEPEQLSLLERELADVDAQGRLDDADRAELQQAEELAARRQQQADAYEAAAVCLTG